MSVNITVIHCREGRGSPDRPSPTPACPLAGEGHGDYGTEMDHDGGAPAQDDPDRPEAEAGSEPRVPGDAGNVGKRAAGEHPEGSEEAADGRVDEEVDHQSRHGCLPACLSVILAE